MGLATIDPHSQKEHTEIHKIPEIQAFKNVKICREMLGHVDTSRHVTGRVHKAIHFFVNFDVFKCLYLSQN